MHSASPTRTTLASTILVIGIILIAANLRAPIAGIGPVLDQMIDSLHLSQSQAGMLTTLPLLAFAIASPLATALAKKQGIEISLFIALIMIALGLFSRIIDSTFMLYISTAIVGIGIAIGNVLLPSLIKRDFPHKIAVMTSAYVLAMGIFAGSYSAIIIPLANYQDLGWKIALASYGIVTIISIVVWLPQLRLRTKPNKVITATKSQEKYGIIVCLGISLFSWGLIHFFPMS